MTTKALPHEVDAIRAQLWRLGYRATVVPRRDAEWQRMTRERICAHCSRKFQVRVPSNEGKYCGRYCYSLARIAREEKVVTTQGISKKYCPQCKTEILLPQRKFCDMQCYQDWRVGKPNGFETM